MALLPAFFGLMIAAVVSALVRWRCLSAALTDPAVPVSDIERKRQRRNTYEYARLTSALPNDRSLDRVFIVISGINMKTSLMMFEHFGIAAAHVPAFVFKPVNASIPIRCSVVLFEIVLRE